MDFTYPPAVEAFRAELAAWLDDHVTDELRGAGHAAGLAPGSERLEQLRAWNRELADAGYAAIAWPVEYGGRGAGVLEQLVWNEELHRTRAPGPINVIGIPNVAPSIMAHGSEDQKTGLLPRMRRGDDIWCQGFSEPDAGSDLASLRTTAVRDGDDWSSRVRRSGPRWPMSPTGASCSCARTRPPRSTRASPASSSTWTAPAWRCGRS